MESSRPELNTDSDRLCAIIDSLPKAHEMIVREWPDDYPGNYRSWADNVGHPVNAKGRCKTCGNGITCPFAAFWDALVSSVVRELDKRYRISRRGPGRHLCVCTDSVYKGRTCPSPDSRNGCPREGESGKTFRERVMEKYADAPWAEDPALLPDEEPDLSHEDTLFVFGSAPSYRCYVSRHEDCEDGPGQPEEGCTCACHGGPRERHCGGIGDHDPHGECWGSGPFRKDRRREWLKERREEAGLADSAIAAKCAPLKPEIREKLFAELRQENEPQFGVPGCKCRPFTHQGESRYLDRPGDTVDMVSGWETKGCPLHDRKKDA